MAAAPLPMPELMDELVGEILLRLPPDDPACLFRASLVCKPWRRTITDAAFDRRYRRFHGAPPVLGFLRYDGYREAPYLLVPTTATAIPFSAPPEFNGAFWSVHECRHWRALLRCLSGFIVWDPITGDRHYLAAPFNRCDHYTATVLCGVDGCDHLSCHDGPWLVVFVATALFGGATTATVYSSETGAWGASPSSIQLDADHFVWAEPSLLTGDSLYFTLGRGILKYDLARHGLSVIDAPNVHRPQQKGSVVTAEDGGLGFVTMKDDDLYLWSRQVGSDGTARWAQARVIHLRAMLPDRATWSLLHLFGFAEGTDTIFIGNAIEIFTIKVKSGKVRKVGTKGSRYTIVPYITFYTPAAATGSIIQANVKLTPVPKKLSVDSPSIKVDCSSNSNVRPTTKG